MRTGVSEMADEFMRMEHEKKMSRRDRARKKFAAKFKLEQAKKRGLKNIMTAERERFLDIEEQL